MSSLPPTAQNTNNLPLPNLFATADGSLTLINPEAGEAYHNRAGAWAEAMQNYALPSQGAQTLAQQGHLTLIDACFGLGYNTWALLAHCMQTHKTGGQIRVIAIENDPNILQKIPQIFQFHGFDPLKPILAHFEHNLYYQTFALGAPPLTTTVEIDGLTLHVEFHLGDLRQVVPSLVGTVEADLVFHDPFSPQKVPHLWTLELFDYYHQLLKQREGKLLTYSSAGAVRGGLQQVGFTLYRTAGLGAKSGGTLGQVPGEVGPAISIHDTQLIFELTEAEHAFVASRAGIAYRDPGFNQTAEAIMANRTQEQAQSNRPSGQRNHPHRRPKTGLKHCPS